MHPLEAYYLVAGRHDLGRVRCAPLRLAPEPVLRPGLEVDFSSNVAGGSGSEAAAIERAVAELGTYTPAGAKPPLLVSPAPSAGTRTTAQGSVGLALLAGAVVALAGGLLWAGLVIATRLDIGIVAWIIGAATGGTVLRVLGGPVPGATKVVAGLVAAGAIVLGKYVIFVHDVRKTIGALLAEHGLSAGYLDSRQMSIFIHNFSSIVRPIYALWILGAFIAAVRMARGKRPRPVR